RLDGRNARAGAIGAGAALRGGRALLSRLAGGVASAAHQQGSDPSWGGDPAAPRPLPEEMMQFQVTFDAASPQQLGAFWALALGYIAQPLPPGFDTLEDFFR